MVCETGMLAGEVVYGRVQGGCLQNILKTLGKYETIVESTYGRGMVVGWRWGGSGMGFGAISQTHA